jgi:uncharacterized protein YjbI with pentapeptide repeats
MGGWDFSGVNLSGGNLDRANLQDADFTGSDLTGVRVRFTDLRGARNVSFAGTVTSSTIRPDGTVTVFQGGATEIRNYVGTSVIPIHVTSSVRTTTFDVLFDHAPWGSTISFEPGISVDLSGGELWLKFEAGVDPSTEVGRTFRLFDWTGINLQTQFRDTSSVYEWDFSELYVDGTVTLLSVPEPGMAVAWVTGLIISFRRRMVLSGYCRKRRYGRVR